MAVVKSLCVYCGSSAAVDARYRAAASGLGALAAANGIEIVYGGGRVGLMGLVAEAALAAGGRVTGIIPQLLHEREVAHTGLSRLLIVANMHERKQRMFELSDAFVTLPGGLGTLDETIEIITWKQLGLHDKPLIIVDVDNYWAPLRALFEHVIATGFTAAGARSFFRVVSDIVEVLPAIAALPEPTLLGKSTLV